MLGEWQLWCLVVLAAAVHHQVLWHNETFFFRDLYLHFFYRKQAIVELLRTGVPLWDPLLNGGQPLLAEPSSSMLYPSTLLWLVLAPIVAFNINIVLHFMACSASAYIAARGVRLTRSSALVTGLAFGFSGHVASTGNLLGFLQAMTLVPVLFLCWNRFLVHGRVRWFVASAALGAVQVFAGAPEVVLLTVALLLAWSLAVASSVFSPWRRAAWAGGLSVSMAGLAGVQIVPTLEMVRLSMRARELASGSWGEWSLPLKRLPETVLPGFFGHLDRLQPELYYWGATITDEGTPYLLSIYLGPVLVVLAIAGAVSRLQTGQLGRVHARLLLGIAALATVGALGDLWFALLGLEPPTLVLRYPVKLLLLATLPLALLAGRGHAALTQSAGLREGLGSGRWWRAAVILTAGCFSACAAVALISEQLVDRFVRLYFERQPSEIAAGGVQSSIVHAAAMLVGLALVLHLKRPVLRSALVVVLLAVDLIAGTQRVNPTVPREFFDPPAAVDAVQANREGGRLYRDPDAGQEGVGDLKIVAPSNHIMWVFRWKQETLASHTATSWGIPQIFHQDFTGLVHERVGMLRDALKDLPWERKAAVLRAASVSVVVTADPDAARVLVPVMEIPERSTRTYTLYRVPSPAPLVNVVSRWREVGSPARALPVISSPSFDPATEAVIEHGLPSADHQKPQPRKPWVRELRRTPTHWEGEVYSDGPGLLVFSQPAYPGWEVRIDGRAEPQVPANIVSSAVRLRPGLHHVVRSYRPRSLVLGAALTVVTALAIVAVAVVVRRW